MAFVMLVHSRKFIILCLATYRPHYRPCIYITGHYVGTLNANLALFVDIWNLRTKLNSDEPTAQYLYIYAAICNKYLRMLTKKCTSCNLLKSN